MAFSPSYPVPMWLHGQEVKTDEVVQVCSPATNEICWTACTATVEYALAAVDSCARAFETWKLFRPSRRRDIFIRAHDILKASQQECRAFAETETASKGTQFDMQFNDALELCMSLAGLTCLIQGTIPTVQHPDKRAMVTKEPLGVILAIAPWNAPHTLGLRACLAPLAAGNTVLLKVPELAPATFWHFVKALHSAGLPPGALNTVCHRPEAAGSIVEALISHPAIKKVDFTGSERVGSIIASLGGKYLKPCLLELGGKAPAIVCEDADLALAADMCILGAMTHAGQICMSTERIIVRQEIAAEFEEALKRAVIHHFGPETAAMHVITRTSNTRHISLVDDATSKGATVVWALPCGGTTSKPAILKDLRPDMKLYGDESFGPLVTLHTVRSDDAAIALANDTRYGLSSAVFSKDLARAMVLASRIDAGATHINSMTIHDEATLPHGGVKASGWGRHNGMQGLDEWLKTKVTTWVL